MQNAYLRFHLHFVASPPETAALQSPKKQQATTCITHFSTFSGQTSTTRRDGELGRGRHSKAEEASPALDSRLLVGRPPPLDPCHSTRLAYHDPLG